jgi:hypothetical protein
MRLEIRRDALISESYAVYKIYWQDQRGFETLCLVKPLGKYGDEDV